MANRLLRTVARSQISRCIFEKSVASVMCTDKTSRMLEHMETQCHPLRYMSTKGTTRHAGTSTTVEEENSDSDYDSDDEKKDDSPFWRRKLRTLHNHLDVNKDGVISYDDFMLLAERFSKLGHLSPEAKIEFKNVLNEMWREQWGDISPYNLICVEKYLEEMHHVLHDKSLRKKYHKFLPLLFKAIDKDRSGQISVEEFKLFFRCLGLPQDNAVIAFSHIDINADGKISFDEFVTLGREFFLTKDETKPSKYFWGPLVD